MASTTDKPKAVPMDLTDFPSLTDMSKIVPTMPKKKDSAGNQEENKTSKPWASALVAVEDESGKATSPMQSAKVEEGEAKSQVTQNTASNSVNEVQPQSKEPEESKKEPTNVNAEPNSAEDLQRPTESNKALTDSNVDSKSAQDVESVSKEPVESKEEPVESKEEPKTKQDVDDAPVNDQSSRPRGVALTSTVTMESTSVLMKDELADEALMQPINVVSEEEEYDDVVTEKHVDNAEVIDSNSNPVEQKEESITVQMTGEVADKASLTPKNENRKHVEFKEEPTIVQITGEVAGNASLIPKNDDHKQEIKQEVGSLEDDSVRDKDTECKIEIQEDAGIRTVGVEELEGKTEVQPVTRIKTPDEYQQIKFDESYIPDSNIEQKFDWLDSRPKSRSSSVEPLNPEEPDCGVRSSILSDPPEQQGGMMRPVVALLVTVAIASAIFGLYSIAQQRE